MEEKIVGTVERIVFRNENSNFYILDVKDRVNESHTVLVNHPNIIIGLNYSFSGKVEVNDKFGKQIRCNSVSENRPETKEAITKYLSSSLFKGIGPSIAKKVVEHFGEDILEVLNEKIKRLVEVPGISTKKIKVIQETWVQNVEINEIMVFLTSYNISTLYAAKIYEYFGQNCIAKIKENPYKLMNIEGVGFRYADEIAMSLNFPRDSKVRVFAGLSHIIQNSEIQEGHCFLYIEQIIQKVLSLLGYIEESRILEVFEELKTEEKVKVLDINGEQRVYLTKTFFEERYVADKIGLLMKNKILVDESKIKDWERELEDENIDLSEEQKNAVLGIVSSSISVLSGGPGTGKTFITNSLIKLLERLGINYMVISPTGRAASKISEVCGVQASTIHRALEFNPAVQGFVKNEKNQLEQDFIICDESSMIDVSLMCSLMKAVKNDAQIIFIGDYFQLPSVSCGFILSDLINSNFVNTYLLTKIYRQGKDSHIIKAAYDVNNGVFPNLANPLENPGLWENKDFDCLFIESEQRNDKSTTLTKGNSLHYGFDVLDMIKRLYTKTIPRYYSDLKEIQILLPMNKSEVGTNAVNDMIQSIVNPPSPGKNEIKIKNRFLREGDKVIQVVNNYDLDCYNGMIGKIISINPEEKEILVEFGVEKRRVLYKGENMFEIKLANSISIHKSQGSDFDVVILPIVNCHYPMLYRNIFYTGITRAKKLCIILGNKKALERAIRNVDNNKRQTSLRELLELKK